MRTWIAAALGAGLLAGCAEREPPLSAEAAAPSAATWGSDADGDGIDDGVEWELANRYAPILYMPNLISRSEAAYVDGDWTRPATVQWYLPRTRMRMHHNNCDDHPVLEHLEVNTTNLLQQAHRRFVLGWSGCNHVSPVIYSDSTWHEDDHFFLQAVDDDLTHPGLLDPAQWETYAHVYRNKYGGINVQYWFFYAYNDFFGSFNHEGDWEHVTLRLDANHDVTWAHFSAHGALKGHAPGALTWSGTHPYVWVADGSHANYPSAQVCNSTTHNGVPEECWTYSFMRWFTWSGGRGTEAGWQGAGLINVGEARRTLPGGEWVRYSGTWGEQGNINGTSGPRGPAYQKTHWQVDMPTNPGSVGSEQECTPSPSQILPCA